MPEHRRRANPAPGGQCLHESLLDCKRSTQSSELHLMAKDKKMIFDIFDIYTSVYLWYELVTLSSVDGQTSERVISHLRQWRTKALCRESAQPATCWDFSSTNGTLVWTSAPSCLPPLLAGTSAQQSMTTSLLRCAWRAPNATEPSTSSARVKTHQWCPEWSVDLWILVYLCDLLLCVESV